jgi:hypothetical protein
MPLARHGDDVSELVERHILGNLFTKSGLYSTHMVCDRMGMIYYTSKR